MQLTSQALFEFFETKQPYHQKNSSLCEKCTQLLSGFRGASAGLDFLEAKSGIRLCA